MKGLIILGKTNVPYSRIIAWHSPHSLTWSWSLWMAWPGFGDAAFKPIWSFSHSDHFGWGGAIGIGRTLSAFSYRTNGGRQFGFTILGLSVSLNRQRPMWYRDLYQQKQREDEEVKRQRTLMHQFGSPSGRLS